MSYPSLVTINELNISKTANSNNATSTNICRTILIYDRSPNGAGYPGVTTIFSDVLQSNTIQTGSVYSNLNPTFYDRFVVLMDKTYIMPPVNTGELGVLTFIGPTTHDNYKIDEYIKLKGLETVFKTTSNPSVIGNVTVGALYLVCLGDVADQQDVWCLAGQSRLRFMDA